MAQQVEPAAGGHAGTAVFCLVAFLVPWAPDRVLLHSALATVAVLLSGRLPRMRPPEALAILLSAWVFATLMWTSNDEATLQSGLRYASSCLIFAAARHIVTTGPRLLAIGYSYLAACAAVSLKLIGQSILDGEPTYPSLELEVRLGIQGTNINFTAYSLVTGVLLICLLLRTDGQPRSVRLCLYTLVAVSAYGVALNGTKGALIALALLAPYLILSKVAPRLAWTVVLVAVPTLLVVVPLGLISDSGLLHLDELFGHSTTGDVAGRLLVWPHAVSTWSEAVMTGIGAGVFTASNPYEIGPHTILLTLGNDLGLTGICLYAAVVASALGPAASRETPVNRRLAGLLLVGMFPLWLTGHWEASPAAWLALALFSTVPWTLSARGRNTPT